MLTNKKVFITFIQVIFLLSNLLCFNDALSDEVYNQSAILTLNKNALDDAKSYQSYAVNTENKAYKNSHSANLKAQQLSQIGLTNWQSYMQKAQMLQSQYASQNQVKKPYHGLIIFASLGMPYASLKALVQQADQYHVPIIIQGLYDNSFKLTAHKIFDLVKPEKSGQPAKGGILIDPNWFTMYDVKKVPAFVITKQFEACQSQTNCKVSNYDILYGNISLEDALRIFKKKGQKQFQSLVDQFIEQGAKANG